ncbi:ABC transporter substrate-binding protein [Salipiger pallidus]|uniref:ABC transporter substrate-binding protein n=1 Tax=Salipiger pallidus TaxID=1775170 RepID=A0A8J2ZGV0_9RHOB|nr:DctP family TRAP transporter solute-binding subunit [Salipiger pallidus]GGG61138.1 ABC transporter substrate-binding protein [Salipiger pallidus]
MTFGKLITTAAMAVALCAPGIASAETFRLSSETNENSSRTQGAERFAELLDEASGGDMTVKVFPNAVLTGGDQLKQGEMLARGSLDFSVTSAITISTLVPEMSAFSLPYLFSGYDEVDAAVNGPAGEEMARIMEEHDLKLLAWGESGFRELTNSKRPIRTPEDLAGLKIRVAGPMFIDVMSELGANPQQIQWTETFSALQQGVVDGQENPIGAVIIPQRVYEVQKYITNWHYSYDPAFLMMSLAKWEALDPEQQEMIQTAATEAMDWQKELTREQTEEGIQLLKDEGMEVYDPTPEELEAFAEAAKPAFDLWADKVGRDLVELFTQTPES